MPVTITNDALQNPFYLLAITVRDLCAGGRRALGAILKPELFRRYRITEQQLGFERFGDFLRAAQRAGFVQLSFTPGGDLEVWPTASSVSPVNTQAGFPAPLTSPVSLAAPPSQPTTWPATQPVTPVRVRPDLWNAFTSFNAMWVYDVPRDCAYKAPGPIAAETQGSNLLTIPPARDRTVEWMRAFAQVQDPDSKSRLEDALHGDSAPYNFNSAVRANPRLHRAWRRYHIQQVVAAIEAWAASNDIHPKEITTPFQRAVRDYWSTQRIPAVPTPASLAPIEVPPAPAARVNLPPRLTPRLASLIDEMIDELLRLRGALQIEEKR
jgi:hypothetical protein